MQFSGNDEYKQSEFTNKAEVGDNECENGANSPQPSISKKSPPPTPTRTRRHSLISEEKYNLFSPPKVYTPNKIVTSADAASLTSHKDNYINYDSRKLYYSHPYKYDEEKQPKRQLRSSNSFNHSTNQAIDIAEVLATTVSLVQDNNRKLDQLSDEVTSEQSSESNMDSDDNYSWQSSRREIKKEIDELAAKLESMKKKYEEQIHSKNRLIEELEYALKKSEKDGRRKRTDIERLETKIEAQKRALDELIEQQNLIARSQSPDSEQAEAFRLLQQELDENNKVTEELQQKIR
ncbi:13620_t:CDS:2, partial [Racocetra fulgida]